MRLGNKTVFGGAASALLLLLGGAAWVAREPLLCWYSLRGLEKAEEGDRDLWAERVAGLGAAALPGLLECLGRDDPRACANAGAALLRLAGRWEADDARGADLARRLDDGFARLSAAGRAEALRLAVAWLKGEAGQAASPDAARQLAGLLPEAGKSKEPEARGQALELASLLLERPRQAGALIPARELARACFADADADNRARAVRLALHPGMDLRRPVLPLLRDPAAEVRRLAILVVGPATDVIANEDLLRWLHDPDPEVRRLCEVALGGRHLPEDHIRLGRLLTHEEPRVRVQVLDHLYRAEDLDTGVWLRYLSHDQVPSVRAAAMRAATSAPYERVRFSDRLEQMRSDPSPTVGQLAQYFLPVKKRQEATAAP